MKALLIILVFLAGCSSDVPENVNDANVSEIVETRIAIEASHSNTDIKWVVPSFSDLRRCTDRELLNISIFCAIGQSASDVNDFIWLGNKLMPERFKFVDPNETVSKFDFDPNSIRGQERPKWL